MVHGLFFRVIALVLVVGVTCSWVKASVEAEAHIEFTAGIVAQAAPKWLGNMAKAVHPCGVDVLLRYRRPW